LWHCESFQELGSVCYEEADVSKFPSLYVDTRPPKKGTSTTTTTTGSSQGDAAEAEETMTIVMEETENNDKVENKPADVPSFQFIHSNVAMHSRSNLAVLLRNACDQIEVLDTSNRQMSRKETITVSEKNGSDGETQTPLYATFAQISSSGTPEENEALLVLTRTNSRAPILRQYKVMFLPNSASKAKEEEVPEQSVLEDVTGISPLSQAVAKAMESLSASTSTTTPGAADLSAPDSILEKDEWGNLMLNKSKENPNHQEHDHKKSWNTYDKKTRDQEKERAKRKRKNQEQRNNAKIISS
jgi:hypothetical protein